MSAPRVPAPGWSAPYQRVSVSLAQLLTANIPNGTIARLADVAQLVADADGKQAHYGVSIDPLSDVRQLVAFFDDDPTPVALIRATVIERPFRRLRLAPAAPASWNAPMVPLPAGSVPSTADMRAQAVIVRLWRVPPPAGMPRDLRSFTSWVSPLYTLSGAFAGPVALLHLPGVTRVRLWGTNENTTATQPIAARLFSYRAEVGPDQSVLTFAQRDDNGLGTGISIPAAPDGGGVDAEEIVLDVARPELALFVTTTAPATFRVGVHADFDFGA